MPLAFDDRASSGPFATRVVADRAAFDALRPEWNALADRTGAAPMMRHEWLSAAADAFARGPLAVFLAHDGKRLRAAAPLLRRARHARAAPSRRAAPAEAAA